MLFAEWLLRSRTDEFSPSCSYSRGMVATPLEPVGEEQFDALVAAALDRVPPELAR